MSVQMVLSQAKELPEAAPGYSLLQSGLFVIIYMIAIGGIVAYLLWKLPRGSKRRPDTERSKTGTDDSGRS